MLLQPQRQLVARPKAEHEGYPSTIDWIREFCNGLLGLDVEKGGMVPRTWWSCRSSRGLGRFLRPGWAGLALLLLLPACQQSGTPVAGTAAAFTGAQLYQRCACYGCHSLQGEGGTLGPALDRLQERLTRTDVQKQILAPRQRRLNSRMPSFAFLRPEEVPLLVAFLHPERE